MKYLEFNNGDKVKFVEDVVYCEAKYAFDPELSSRVAGVGVNGEFTDGDGIFYNAEKLNQMKAELEKHGFIKGDNIVIPAGEVGIVDCYDYGSSIITFKNNTIILDINSIFTDTKPESDDEYILVEAI